MMSDYEATVNNFIHLLKTQPALFSKEENTQLVELLNSKSDDIESLSNTISDWLEEHPQVDDALAELEDNIQVHNPERGPGSSKLNSNIPKYQKDKKSILNAIQQSSESTRKDDNKDDKS